MIREARFQDIPDIVQMVGKLHAAAKIAVPVQEPVVERSLRNLIASPMGLVLVVGDHPTGFLAASIGGTSVSMLPIAVEHGWYCEGGGGLDLLRAYEKWARQQHCHAIRMSSPPDAERVGSILSCCGYDRAEQAWVKVL